MFKDILEIVYDETYSNIFSRTKPYVYSNNLSRLNPMILLLGRNKQLGDLSRDQALR